jgi:outer membrane lipoprotein-sorting protein
MTCRILVLASVISLLCSCRVPPVQRPYAPPSAEELLAALHARIERLSTLRATAKVDELEGGQRVKVKVALIAARGGKLRLEADSPLGGNVAVLTADGSNFALLDVRNNRFLAGPATACNVARLIRLELPPDDVVAVLMGDVPLEGTPSGVDWDPEHGGREILSLRTPDGGSEKIFLDAGDRRWDPLLAERRDAQGKVVWRVTHDRFADHGGIRLPEVSTVEEPPFHVDAQIKFRALEPNVQLPDSVFRQDPPSGIAVEQATCAE